MILRFISLLALSILIVSCTYSPHQERQNTSTNLLDQTGSTRDIKHTTLAILPILVDGKSDIVAHASFSINMVLSGISSSECNLSHNEDCEKEALAKSTSLEALSGSLVHTSEGVQNQTSCMVIGYDILLDGKFGSRSTIIGVGISSSGSASEHISNYPLVMNWSEGIDDDTGQQQDIQYTKTSQRLPENRDPYLLATVVPVEIIHNSNHSYLVSTGSIQAGTGASVRMGALDCRDYSHLEKIVIDTAAIKRLSLSMDERNIVKIESIHAHFKNPILIRVDGGKRQQIGKIYSAIAQKPRDTSHEDIKHSDNGEPKNMWYCDTGNADFCAIRLTSDFLSSTTSLEIMEQ